MIRRLNKHSDLKDLIKSCPSGVIDDIYAIEYYIQGHNETIQANFTKKGDLLEVILPSSDLETLPNGILMRRAFYKVLDASYPDGYYNLEFEDNLNVWLGEVESEEPVIPEYVTEEELAETLGDYTTQEWVENKGYITTSALSGYATESWVSSQGYLTSHQDLSSYATQSWVSAQGYLTSHQDLTGYATESWVLDKRYVTGEYLHDNHYVRESWLVSNGYITSSALSGYATQTWVGNQGYLNSASLSGYATEQWVSSQQFATQSWVSSQGYLVNSDLSGYATQSWATNQFLEESKVWTGTEAQWNQLTAEQKASYIIALITQ